MKWIDRFVIAITTMIFLWITLAAVQAAAAGSYQWLGRMLGVLMAGAFFSLPGDIYLFVRWRWLKKRGERIEKPLKGIDWGVYLSLFGGLIGLYHFAVETIRVYKAGMGDIIGMAMEQPAFQKAVVIYLLVRVLPCIIYLVIRWRRPKAIRA